jgi:hypothetical protein
VGYLFNQFYLIKKRTKMKNVTLNNLAKKLFAGSLLVTVLFLTAQNKAFANGTFTNGKINETTVSETASVKYMGRDADEFKFSVKFNNVNSEYFIVLITDENDENLYSTVSNKKNFSTTFVLPQALDLNKIKFTITTNDASYTQGFKLDQRTIRVEDLVVVKR